MYVSVHLKGRVRREVTSVMCALGADASGIRSADFVPAHHRLRLVLLQLLIFLLHQIRIPEELGGQTC
jgi:hypothetical protein